MRRRAVLVRSFCIAAVLSIGGVSQAAVILEVDVSDPSSVVFSTTAAFAENELLDIDSSFNGITLLDFLTGNLAALDVLLDSGAINVLDSPAATGRSALDQIFVGDFPGGWTPNDVSIYEFASSFSTSFLTTEIALTGGASHDLSSLTGLPTPGTLGNVVAGLVDDNDIIGQWVVTGAVPEPATLTLFGVGLAVWVARGRKRKS